MTVSGITSKTEHNQSENTFQPDNKMGTDKIPRLVITMAIPMMLSMLVQALYHIVDSAFIGHYSTSALTAVSMYTPVLNLLIAVESGTSIGFSSYLSLNLGAKDFDEADSAANNGIFVMIMTSLAFAVFGALFARPFFEMQVDDPELISQGTTYMFICCVFSIGAFFQITVERLLQSTGKTVYFMVVQMAGAALNVILDFILIFGNLGFPKLGVAGAAIATVISQAASAVLGLYFNIHFNPEIHLSLPSILRPSGRVMRRIYLVGAPAMAEQSLAGVMTFMLNQLLIAYSTLAVSSLSVYLMVQSIVFLPVFGLSNSMVPIVAYNYGAQKPKRITDAVKFSVVVSTVILVFGTVMFHVFAEAILQIFTTDTMMIEIGGAAFRTISLGYVFAGTTSIMPGVFQAFSKAGYSFVMSVVRRIVVIVPTAYLFAHLFGYAKVWYAFPIAEFVSFCISLAFYRKICREKIAILNTVEHMENT